MGKTKNKPHLKAKIFNGCVVWVYRGLRLRFKRR